MFSHFQSWTRRFIFTTQLIRNKNGVLSLVLQVYAHYLLCKSDLNDIRNVVLAIPIFLNILPIKTNNSVVLFKKLLSTNLFKLSFILSSEMFLNKMKGTTLKPRRKMKFQNSNTIMTDEFRQLHISAASHMAACSFETISFRESINYISNFHHMIHFKCAFILVGTSL